MYDSTMRNQVLALLDQGLTVSEVGRRTGISRFTIREWRLRSDQGRDLYATRNAECSRCAVPPQPPEPAGAYAYLLGLYLGDGCISPAGDPAKKVWALRVICADAWPGLMRECADAIRAVRPDNKVRFIPRVGCTEVKSYSKHWLCLFPQHGPGMKHTRTISLADWQQQIVDESTEEFVRGLLHSDGSRFMNRVRRPLRDGDRWYEYPRYNFTNVSIDIQRLFTGALDRLGVTWKQMNASNISVARREAVALLDEFVGPKH